MKLSQTLSSDAKLVKRDLREVTMTLDERYKVDPELSAFYEENLLIPGWAGELAPYEVTYIRSELKKSARLRRRWGFRTSAKCFSEKRIRDVARNGVKRT